MRDIGIAVGLLAFLIGAWAFVIESDICETHPYALPCWAAQ